MPVEFGPNYVERVRARRDGAASTATANSPFDEVKQEFYIDSRGLSEAVLDEIGKIRAANPPYGLVDFSGAAITTLTSHPKSNPWLRLEHGFASTMLKAFNAAEPPVTGCPYHQVLNEKLVSRELQPLTGNRPDLDVLRKVSAPGGTAAPALIINLLRHIPDMKRLLDGNDSAESLARSSSILLQKPLAHPQQHARAFMFTLTGEEQSDGFSFDREQFLPDQLIRDYIHLETARHGQERFNWSRPTADFVVRAELDITSRMLGSENDSTGKHVMKYPAGTRLGDIAVDEPTLGCPGTLVAYDMWKAATDVIVAEGLWDYAPVND